MHRDPTERRSIRRAAVVLAFILSGSVPVLAQDGKAVADVAVIVDT